MVEHAATDQSVHDITIHPGSECGVKAAKRDLAHIFSTFQISSYSNSHHEVTVA